MKYTYTDYNRELSAISEAWFDEETRRMTGCDDGFYEYYSYWATEPGTVMGENFFCKVIYEGKTPVGVAAFGLNDGILTVSEFVIAPALRGKGRGTEILRELTDNVPAVLGIEAKTAEAVIYPDNTASKRAFEKAGFTFSHAHPDGDALYYVKRLPGNGYSYGKAFWEAAEKLISESEAVTDRPKGSCHPRYRNIVYPVDYGYLKNTSSMDGNGIDIWKGSAGERLDAIAVTVDLLKKDSEIKLLIGCTEDEKRLITEFHNNSSYMKAILIRREETQ